MNKSTYQTVKTACHTYYRSLDINTVKLEFMDKKLTTVNSKLNKGDNNNIGLELIPADLSPGLNICGNETNCKFSCLVFSGLNNMLKTKSIIKGELSSALKIRIRRTFLLKTDSSFFYTLLKAELLGEQLKADLMGQSLFVRLNVFSDIDFRPFIDSLPTIQFYDYTKYWERTELNNYHLTYSASERTNNNHITEKLNAGFNVALVVKTLVDTWNGFDTIDGNKTDNRYSDTRGLPVLLTIKNTVNQKENKNSFLTQFEGTK